MIFFTSDLHFYHDKIIKHTQRPFHNVEEMNKALIRKWNGSGKGAIALHGHQHNHKEYNVKNLQNGILRYDVGVDANNMAPVSAKEIVDFFCQQ